MHVDTVELSQVLCPGCGALVRPTTKVHDPLGNNKELIIPPHSPLPGNKKDADPKKSCPGSEVPAKKGQMPEE